MHSIKNHYHVFEGGFGCFKRTLLITLMKIIHISIHENDDDDDDEDDDDDDDDDNDDDAIAERMDSTFTTGA